MYKISVSNLGYNDTKISEVDGFKSTLKECKSILAEATNDFRKKNIDGFEIEYLQPIKEENFKNDKNLIVLQAIDDIDRFIYIIKEV